MLERRAIAGGADADALAAAYAEAHLPGEVAAAGGHVDEIVEPADTRERLVAVLTSSGRWRPPSPPTSAPETPTEDAILAAAREALLEEPYDAVTIEGIARRAYVSRTTVYFYFPNKRAVVDRLIQRAFADILEAAAPYLEGDGDPRAELHAALAGVVADRRS